VAQDAEGVWAGFWRRVGAFVFDSLLLGALSVALGSLFFDPLASLGSLGRLVGLGLGVVYFGLGASAVFGGQTLGKRLLGLKVVQKNGRLVSLPTALARSAVVVAPIICNGLLWPVTNPVMGLVVVVLSALLVIGLSLAQVVLLLVNGPDRRLVHDLLFGTVVVRAGAVDVPVRTPAPWKLGLAVIVPAVALAALLLFTRQMQTWLDPDMKALTAVQAALLKEPDVSFASVMKYKGVFYPSGKPKRTSETLQIQAQVTRWPKTPELTARRLARIAKATYPQPPKDGVVVVLTYGFDLGFGQRFNSFSANYPADREASARPSAPAVTAAQSN